MKHPILVQLDNSSSTPPSMFAMGMASDAQEAILRGDLKLAIAILDDLKLVIDERLSVKDEHGRHDFPVKP